MMLTNKTVFVLLTVVSFLFIKVETHAQTDNKFVVKGVIDTVPHARYYIFYSQKGTLVRDTVSLDGNRTFEFSGDLSDPARFYMAVENTYNPAFVGDFIIYEFWVEPGVTTSFEGQSNWLIAGAKGLIGSGEITRSEPSKMEETEQRYNNYVTLALKSVEDSAGRPLTAAMRTQVRDSLRKAFISTNIDSHYALYQLHLMARNSLSQEVAFIEDTLPLFPEEIKGGYRAKEIGQRVAVHKITGIGQTMPDFEQTDTSSQVVKLSDFRGKYVLVDFWASWCGPCRKEHPQFVEVYEKFGPERFDILGISLDDSRDLWLEAIQQDGLNWTQVSDLKGTDNVVAKQFFVRAIPDNFLLDPNGVIIARGVKGAELLSKLEEVFEK